MLTDSQAASVLSFAPVIGKPYEGKLHVRFDEGALETEHGGTRRHLAIERAGNSSCPPKQPRQCSTLQLRNLNKAEIDAGSDPLLPRKCILDRYQWNWISSKEPLTRPGYQMDLPRVFCSSRLLCFPAASRVLDHLKLPR